MMTKEEYNRELVRMWDSVREMKKGEPSCEGVICDNGCPLNVENELGRKICWSSIDCFEVIKVVEKWSKEHPQKYKISQLEYDILKIYIDLGCYGTFNGYAILSEILKKGYFAGTTSKTNIRDYFNNCEVKEDV